MKVTQSITSEYKIEFEDDDYYNFKSEKDNQFGSEVDLSKPKSGGNNQTQL